MMKDGREKTEDGEQREKRKIERKIERRKEKKKFAAYKIFNKSEDTVDWRAVGIRREHSKKRRIFPMGNDALLYQGSRGT